MNSSQFIKRQRELIEILYKSDRKRISDELARQLHVSTRTIRNDVREINAVFGMPIILSDRDGYTLDMEIVEYEYVSDDGTQIQENRPQQILQKLLIDGDGIDIDEMADDFFVSKPLLEKNIKQAQDLLDENFHLHLSRKKNKIYLEGGEKEKRRCISHFIYDEYSRNFVTIEKIQEYFPDVDVLFVHQIIDEQMESFQMKFSKWLKLSLVLHFTIAVNWIGKNIDYDTMRTEMELDVEDHDILFTMAIISSLENKFHIIFPREERRNIEYLVKGRKVNAEFNQRERHYFCKIIKDTCKKFQLEVQDNSVDMLAMHIENAVRRLQVNSSTYNPFMNDIKEKSPMMYELAVRICEQIQVDMECVFDDNEIGFVALHLACAFLHFRDTKLNAGIYFPQYHAFKQNIHNFLDTKMNQKVNLIDVSEDLQKHIDELDFIITPVPSMKCKVPVVYISIIPKEEDILKVEEAILRIEKKNKNKKEQKIFCDLFREELFMVEHQLKTREEVLRQMCDCIVHNNVADESFYDDVMAREVISATGFNDTFALPHALHPKASVSRIAIMILKEAMKWGNCKVQLVLLFAINPYDEIDMMPIYEKIIRNLNNDANIALLIKANTYEEFMNIFLTMIEK